MYSNAISSFAASSTGTAYLSSTERARNNSIRTSSHHNGLAPLGSYAYALSPPQTASLPSSSGGILGAASTHKPPSANVPSVHGCSTTISISSVATLGAIITIIGCYEAKIFEW